MNTLARALTVAVLLCGLAPAAQAQRADRGLAHVDRALEAASRVQERVSRAQDRGAQAQDRAGRAAEALARVANVTADGLDVAAAAVAREAREAISQVRAQHGMRVRAYPERLELLDRFAVVRGEYVAVDPSPEVLAAVQAGGFTIASTEAVEGLDLRYVTLRAPGEISLRQGLERLRKLAPKGEFTANHIYFQSGEAPAAAASVELAASTAFTEPAIGLIDGGVARGASVGKIRQQGFAAGAPAANAHATAMASLIAGTRDVKSAAPGSPLLVADIYGRDPAGGNALALTQALGWLAKQGAPVVVIGLVGPANPLVSRAVEHAQARGMIIFAPVGNAGSAAPPMFPAAYPGVVGVTAVDGRNRVLVEAGRGAHVDFAAPGADILAAGPDGRPTRVRGTSYAAPLAAGRLWSLRAGGEGLARLSAEAVDLGQRGRDPQFGQGLVCGACR
jgi:hypothetical protein